MSLTFEPLHISFQPRGQNSLLSVVLRVSKETQSRTNSEADLPSSNQKALGSRYMKRLIHRTEPNRPHISSDTRDFKERRDKTHRMRPIPTARPACITSILVPTNQPNNRVSASVQPVRRPAVHHCAAGEGGSTVTAISPQVVF